MAPPTTCCLSEQEIQNLISIKGIDNKWNRYGFNYTQALKEAYVIDCTKRIDQLEKSFQNCTDVAGSFLVSFSILLATIMVTMMLSLRYYFHHVGKKLNEKNSKGVNAEGNITTTTDVAMDLLPGDRVNKF